MSYREAAKLCPICETERLESVPYAGLELCRPCYEGRNTNALLARGIHVQTVEEVALDGEGDRRSRVGAIGGTDRAVPLQARFEREGFLSRRFKLDLQTGDELFDAAVGIYGKGLELERLLAFEPVRFAIMDLVGDVTLEINDGRVSARASSGVEDLRRAVTVLTWGIACFSREAYPIAEPGPVPWLGLLSSGTQVEVKLQGDRLEPRHLGALPELSFLSLRALRLTTSDLSPLAELVKLEALRLVEIEEVRDLRPLGALLSLSTLVLAGCPVEDLSPLARLTGLSRLNLDRTWVRDLTPLFGLPLVELSVRQTLVDAGQLAALRARRPELAIRTG